MTEPEYFIEMDNVTYQRDGAVLLNKVSFRLAPGEFASLGGGDVSGKTSLLRLCLGLVPPDSGVIRINGKLLAEFSYQELQQFRYKTGIVFQSGTLISNRSIRDNISLPLRYHTTLGSRAIDKQIDKYLELFDIFAYANERPAGLPAEVKLLASLARALIVEPQLLLLDEFFDSISGASGEKVVRHIKEIKQARRLTCLSTTKTVNLLTSFVEEPLIDLIILIEAGGIVEQGRCQAVRDKLLRKLM